MKLAGSQTAIAGKLTLNGECYAINDGIIMDFDTNATSLPMLKHDSKPRNLFSNDFNGGRAGGMEPRGSVDHGPLPGFKFTMAPRAISKQSTTINLCRDRQILTRFQELQIKEVFPFLALPPELRNVIYEYCCNFRGVDKWFANFWKVLQDSPKPAKAEVPMVWRRCPKVLLICKQIYKEAHGLLEAQGLSLHHGLLDIVGLSSLMNTDILKNISSLTIDAAGHAIIPEKAELVGPSWRGHLDMLVDISEILVKGHRLKKFTLNFTDSSLHAHVHDCWGKAIRCDYRDQLAEALRHLRNIRSVGKVTLTGIPTAMVDELKTRMESDPLTFLDLPGEIRNQIYEYAADWSDISTQLARTVDGWFASQAAFKKAPPYPKVSTPTVLLLNKQIHREAKSVLHKKPLVLEMKADERLQATAETLNAIKFITPRTLANVRVFEVRVESWEWVYALEFVVQALATSHRLETFKFVFRDSLKKTFSAQGRPYPDSTLHKAMRAMARLREVPQVVFEGDLPDCYTAPLRMIMESKAVRGEVLPEMKSVQEENGVVKIVEVPQVQEATDGA